MQDDGCGISPEATFGYGLTGMTERVRALGGELKIGSGQNGGTVLELKIPYDEAVAAQGQSAEPEAVTALA